MNTGKRPQSHGKKIGEGSVSVNKTEKVNTGRGPVGAGGRTGGFNRSSGSGRAAQRGAIGGGSVLLFVIIAVVFFVFRGGFGGGQGNVGNGNGNDYTPPSDFPSQPNTTVSDKARPKRYVPLGNGQDTVTVMVYMCGTDLESKYGMASSDLQEMMNAAIADNVNVIVETGGCKMWKNKVISSSTNQIYKVENGGLRLIKDNIGSKAMVEPSTLTEFIKFCKQNYPADRNILIFWDHGGGSISGYGYDELHKESGSMDLAEINSALKAADCTFDWIGFDACLMATLETALVCGDYADYLIASEETEPGTGWHYTGWLTELSRNTSMSTLTLAKKLIDDFVSASTAASSKAQVTLSIVDLAEMQGTIPAAFNGFSTSTAEMIRNKDYASVSNARAGARQFAKSSRINQIDLVDFANRIGTDESKALSSALQDCIKYNRTTISNAYGLSIYFPYESTSSVKPAISTYNQVGMDEAYTKCISSFASLASSGQIATSAGSGSSLDIGSLLGGYLAGSSGGSSGSSTGFSSPLGSLLGGTSAGTSIDVSSIMQLLGAFAGGGRNLPSEMDWLDVELVADKASYIADNYIDPGDIIVTVRPDGKRVLTLTDEQWALIQSVELNVFVDDGEGFIDLGLDNVFEFDGNDLLLDFDGNWLTVNGHIAAFYMDYADDSATVGHIPAMLTQTADGDTVSQFVYLEVVFDEANPSGTITGARPMYTDVTDTIAKGDIAICAGDTIEFLCDYYTYDGDFDSTYKLGDPLTVGSDGLEIVYHDLGDATYSVTYRLTDIYSNHYWTPAV